MAEKEYEQSGDLSVDAGIELRGRAYATETPYV